MFPINIDAPILDCFIPSYNLFLLIMVVALFFVLTNILVWFSFSRLQRRKPTILSSLLVSIIMWVLFYYLSFVKSTVGFDLILPVFESCW